MVKIDIITGFLGSGKTTFIKQYVKYLNSLNERVCVIENDFGTINVDMMLLGDLQSDLCDIEMVIGGDVDCHKRRLKTKLISMAMLGYQRIILEPSGIFDVEMMMDLLHEEPLENWYEINNVITIVDSALDTNMSKESSYILASELTKAGSVILSKSQFVDEKTIENTKYYLNQLLEIFQCKRVLKDEFFTLPWNLYQNKDYERIQQNGYVNYFLKYMKVAYDKNYTTLFFMNLKDHLEELQVKIEHLMNGDFGNIIRIKGFIYDKIWYEVNCTKQIHQYLPLKEGQNVILVIGENLNEEKISEVLKGCI